MATGRIEDFSMAPEEIPPSADSVFVGARRSIFSGPEDGTRYPRRLQDARDR